MMRRILAVLILGIISQESNADDWPQHRGLLRDGKSAETGLLQKWPESGPKLLWTYTTAGVGYAGPAIIGDRLILSGAREQVESVFALDIGSVEAGTVKEVWSTKIGPQFQWKGNAWNTGPNATPTVHADRVYALGGAGELVCVDRVSGKEHWRKNLPRDFGGEVNPIGGGAEDPTPLGWGYANAPLIHGKHVIIAPGGKKGLLAALEQSTGDLIWQSGDVKEQTSYSSPIIITVGGVEQIVQVINSGIVGVSATDGDRLWTYKRSPAYDDVVIATPIFHADHVFATVGFQQGCDLIKLTRKTRSVDAEKVFSNKSIQNREGGLVLVDGHLYGHSENIGWFCQEFLTGKVLWAEKRELDRGSVTYADGNLICCSEKGTIVMIAASTKGWEERGRFKLAQPSDKRLPNGGVWTAPVVANGKLFIRDQDIVSCYDLKK